MGIKEKREAKSMTQTEIAEKLNISRTTVSMWETGDSMPRADKLPALARILDCTIDELMGE